jgi:hypothetical protein
LITVTHKTKVARNKTPHHINHKMEDIFFLYVFFMTLNILIDKIINDVTTNIHINIAENICKNSIA